MTAMGKVPRHEFVPIELQPYAYANIPLPIGFEKTISQPSIVALMTDLLDIKPDDSVLEIGTGLGYQAAILAQLARKVYSVEIIEEQTMIGAVSAFHFGRQIVVADAQGQTRVRTASPAVALYKRCVCSRFPGRFGSIDFVDGSHPKGTQPKIVKFPCTPEVIAFPSEMASAR
jgi:protein-L-isoaspartate O-methyltransferase